MRTAKLTQVVLAAAALGIQLAAIKAQAAVKISSQPTQNMSCSNGVCTPTAKKAVLNVSDLATLLAGGDATVNTGGNVAQDIEIDAALGWTSTSHLTLNAYRSITFNKPVTVAGTGALTITTNDGGSGGDFRFFGKGHVEFWNTTSSLIISNQRYALAKSIKQINRLSRHRAMYIALAKSLDAAKDGTYSSAPIEQGGHVFEGLGNVISNLSIADSTSESDVALFLAVGTLRDLGLLNFNINATGTSQCVGSLVALNMGTVLHSYASGIMSAGENSIAGGLACNNQFGTIAQSDSAVAVSAGSNSIVGGLVGINETFCIIENCTGNIDQTCSAGGVSGGDLATAGGLIGQNYGGIVSNSYALGAVSVGSNGLVGGLVGSNENNPNEGSDPKIGMGYSIGPVVGGSGATVGGLIGSDTADPGITNTYWDLDTSGISNPHQGAGNVADDPGITGLTDAQLKSSLPPGFDNSVWHQAPGANNGYPYLLFQPS